MDIFDIEPELEGIAGDYGPEPSLRSILINYYGQVFDMDGSVTHADLYIEALKSKVDN